MVPSGLISIAYQVKYFLWLLYLPDYVIVSTNVTYLCTPCSNSWCIHISCIFYLLMHQLINISRTLSNYPQSANTACTEVSQLNTNISLCKAIARLKIVQSPLPAGKPTAAWLNRPTTFSKRLKGMTLCRKICFTLAMMSPNFFGRSLITLVAPSKNPAKYFLPHIPFPLPFKQLLFRNWVTPSNPNIKGWGIPYGWQVATTWLYIATASGQMFVPWYRKNRRLPPWGTSISCRYRLTQHPSIWNETASYPQMGAWVGSQKIYRKLFHKSSLAVSVTAHKNGGDLYYPI